MKTTPIILLSLFLLQTSPAQSGDLEVFADKQVEIHQNEKKLVAVGNAIAQKDGNTIKADTLTAFYTEDKEGKTTFKTLHAKGKVKAEGQNAQAYGETLDYDLSKEEVILTGKPAKIINQNGDIITAEDKIIYYPKEAKATAYGNVTAHNKQNKVQSDEMISYFEKDKQGNLAMDKVNIKGHVKITTPQATATSQRGIYLPKEGKVKLYENVEINQDGSIIRGSYAETDLNTGISRMLAGENGGRVSGIFRQSSQKKINTSSNKEEKNHAE